MIKIRLLRKLENYKIEIKILIQSGNIIKIPYDMTKNYLALHNVQKMK